MSVLPYLISLAISTGVGLYAWRRRAVPGAAPFALVALSQASMTLGYVFELISPGLEAKIFWDDTQWLGALACPMALLAFALEYTGRKLSHPRRTWGLLAIVPIVFLLLVATDDLHGLIRPVAWLVPGEPFSALVYDFTLAVWVASLFGYGVALSSFLILAVHFARSPRLYRAQVGVILAGILIPMVGTILTLVGITLTFHRDTTPLTFVLGNLVIAWGLFRYRLFDIVPTARDAVIESMGDAAIVLDARDRVVDLNPAAQEIIGRTASQAIGQPAAWVFSRWPDLVEQYQDATEAHAEIVLGEKEGQRHFDLRLEPLRGRRGRFTGRLVVLRDITERVEKNAQLARANEQLTRQIAGRVQAEEVLRVSHRFLEIANRHTEMPALLKECVAQVRAFTGCAAVGIRLLDDRGNIPYHAYEGFSQGFYESESPLSIRSDQCMCINVIRGDADPGLSYYTEGGSFYMNGTTRFLATVSEEEKGKTRNVCNQVGYESVALVPIRLEDRILGLIHVADPRENVVPLEMVQALEGASKELGTAIQRVRAEAALQRARDELEQRVEERTAELSRANVSLTTEIAERTRAQEALIREKEFSDDILASLPGIFYMYDEERMLVRWSKQPEALGYSAEDMAHHHVLDFFEGEDKALIKSRVDQIFATGQADAEALIVTKSGERIPYYFTGKRTMLGGKEYFVGLGIDISERVRAEEALRRYAERLQILHDIDQGILAAQSPATIAQAAVTRIRQLIPCQRAGVTLFDFAAHEALLLAVDLDAESQVEPGARIPLEPFEDVIAAGRQGSVAVVTELESRGRVAEALFVEGIHSFVGVPLLFQGELIGTINFSLGVSDPSAFAREWEDVARQVADELSIAIQQARLYEQVQRHATELEGRLAARTRELAAFFDLATLTARGQDLPEVLEPALARISDVAHCQAMCVHLLDEEGRALKLLSQRNLPAEARQQLGVMTLGDDFSRRVSRPGDPLATTDLAGSALLPRQLCLEGFRTYLGVPLRAGGRSQGWLSYYRASAQGFTLDETALLAALAEQIGVIVENHNLRRRTEEAAVLEERGRLARELHDSVTQSLYSSVLLTEGGRRLAASGDMDGAQGYFSDLEGIALQALKEMRLLVHELRPSALEGEGLVGALQGRLDAVEGRAGVETRLLVEGAIELPAAAEGALYGIAQEALNNALKHASATSVTVRVRSGGGGRVELEIVDNGRGFDPDEIGSKGGMGLATMRERAEGVGGTLQVISAPGEGTTVKVSVGTRGNS